MKLRTFRLFPVVVLALATIGVGGTAGAAAVPAGSTVEGKTLAEWSAAWWIWALETPGTVNPVLDTTGEFASSGDMGSVFFLAGLNSSGSVTRTFLVPSGKYIFFPLINSFLVAEGTESEMRARLADYIASVTKLHATVDGVDVSTNLFSHREISPTFDFVLPADNLFGDPTFAGSYTGTVSDGYWIMLEPLSPGVHTIRFGGSSIGGGGLAALTVDVTYAVPEPVPFWTIAGATLACASIRKLRARH